MRTGHFELHYIFDTVLEAFLFLHRYKAYLVYRILWRNYIFSYKDPLILVTEYVMTNPGWITCYTVLLEICWHFSMSNITSEIKDLMWQGVGNVAWTCQLACELFLEWKS